MIVAGVDEAGRGPLAGPVIAAAVILHPDQFISGLADSKQLSPNRREELFHYITNSCLAWAVGRADVHEIDQLNILQASLLAMTRAINKLTTKPNKILIDGNQVPNNPYPSKAIIRGDQTVPVISAASIVAKVLRDREMVLYDAYYPEYGFAQHKGYGTKRHLEAIRKYDITPIHRRSFVPCINNHDEQ